MEKVVSRVFCTGVRAVVFTGMWLGVFKVEKLQGGPNEALLAKDPYHQMAKAKSELKIRQLLGRRLHEA